MLQSPDIAVYDKQGRQVLVAEVKAKPGSSPEWATRMRRNLAAHGIPGAAKYFLLAVPDRLYFWADKMSTETAPPDISFDSSVVLEPYYKAAGMRPGRMAESSLELIVASWLNELVAGEGENRLPEHAARWLRSEGLLDAIRGGRLEQH